MTLYIVPELRVPNGEIVNVIGKENEPVGFMSIMFSKEDEKMYVHGCLKERGVEVEFLDVIGPYVKGLSKSLNIKEISTYVCVGGEEKDLFKSKDDKSGESGSR